MSAKLALGRSGGQLAVRAAILSRVSQPQSLLWRSTPAARGYAKLSVYDYRQPKPLDLKDTVVKEAVKARFKEFDLANRAAIVTGGAQGLGLAMAEVLVEAGGHGT